MWEDDDGSAEAQGAAGKAPATDHGVASNTLCTEASAPPAQISCLSSIIADRSDMEEPDWDESPGGMAQPPTTGLLPIQSGQQPHHC